MRKIDLSMERIRNGALVMIAVLNVIATVVSAEESYAGLYQWAHQHDILGFNAGIWPLMVDLIILVAEAGLFVAHHDKWKARHKAWLWFVLSVALGVSVGGNTGHIRSTDWLSHLTAGLPPAALFFTMSVGFGVMKRTFMHKPVQPSQPVAKTPLEGPRTPMVRTSGERSHVGTEPWFESPALAGSQIAPAPSSHPETPAAETVTERPAPAIPESLEPTETFAGVDFRATEKSFSMPRDPRQGLKLPEMRVRDMYDVDPDISVNAIKNALGCAWQTAKNYLDATKEARGLPA